MNTFRLLGSASCVAILACATTSGAFAAPPIQVQVPVQIQTVDARRVEALIGFDLSGFNAGTIVPGISGGIKVNGLGNSQLSLGVDGGFGLRQPGNVTELSVISRLGFRPTDVSTIEVLAGGGGGVIAGSPFYQLNAGAEFGVSPMAGILVEGVVRAPWGVAPTDFGVHTSVRLYPGRFGSPFGDDGKTFETGFVTDPTSFWAGPSVTAIPSASAVIPAIDAGFTYKVTDKFDLGLRGSLGMQFPAGTYEASGGGEVGYELTPELRALLFGEIGTIGGGFIFNRVGVGAQFKVAPTFSLVGELSGRGALGTITEGGFKFGSRFNFLPTPMDGGGNPAAPLLGGPNFDPYVGKSLGYAPASGIWIPGLEFGANFPMESRIIPGVRGRFAYHYPVGVFEASVGGQLGFNVTPQFTPYVFGEIGTRGGATINSVGAGGEYMINGNWGVGGEASASGHLGSFTDMAIRFRTNYHLTSTTAGFRYQW